MEFKLITPRYFTGTHFLTMVAIQDFFLQNTISQKFEELQGKNLEFKEIYEWDLFSHQTD